MHPPCRHTPTPSALGGRFKPADATLTRYCLMKKDRDQRRMGRRRMSGPAEVPTGVDGQGWCGPAPKRKRRPEGLRNPSPLCLTPCVDQVRGAASTVWRNGVEGFLVATAGARDAGACATG